MQMPEEDEVQVFQREIVLPALRDFGRELDAYGLRHRICDEVEQRGAVRLEVLNGADAEFVYEVRNRAHALPPGEHAASALDALSDDAGFHRAEVHLVEGGQDYCIMGWTREQVAMDVLNQFSQHVQFVQSMR
jgi:choline/glycine/proline betaine transport protein